MYKLYLYISKMLRIGNDPENGISSSINIHKGTGRIGISRDPTRYMFDVSGSFNCTNLNVNGKPFIGGGGGGSSEFILEDTNTYDFIEYIPGEAPDGTSGSSVWDVSSDSIYYTTGNVGIGTTSPSEKLTIHGSSSTTVPCLGLRNGNANNATNDGAQIAFGWNGNNQYQHFIQTRHNGNNASENAIDFFVCDSTQNNTVTSGSTHTMSLVSGNVGIGTNAPAALLHLKHGSITETKTIFTTQTQLSGIHTSYFKITENKHGAGTSWTDYSLKLQRTVDVTTQGYIEFGPEDEGYGIALGTGGTELMRLTQDGNVGIGTDLPSAKLTVRKDGLNKVMQTWVGDLGTNNGRTLHILSPDTDSVDAPFKFTTGNAITFRIDSIEALNINSGGKVGIGTSSFSNELDISGNARMDRLTIGDDLDSTGNVSVVIKDNGTGNGHGNVTSAGGLRIVSTAPQVSGSVDLLMGVNHNSKYAFLQSTEYAIQHQNLIFQPVGGNVGIGTTSPSENLTINGSDTATVPCLGLRNGNGYITTNDGAQIAFGWNGTNKYQHFIQTRHNGGGASDNAIDFYVCDRTQNNTVTSGSTHTMTLNSGKVGIGTTSPSDHLTVQSRAHIADAALTVSTFGDSTQSGENAKAIIYLGTAHRAYPDSRSGKKCAIIADGIDSWGRNSLHFCLNNSVGSDSRANSASITDSRMVIQSAGNVGIGTTSPSSKLHIHCGSTATSDGLFIGNDYESNNQVTFLRLGLGVNNYAQISAHTELGDKTYLQFHTQSDTGTSNISERMRIDENGNVGIGTTSPSEKLDVNGNARMHGLTLGNDGTLMIESITGGGGTETVILQTSIDNISLADSNRYTYPTTSSATDRKLMCLQPYDGRVGIGTTSPSEKLHVNGIIRGGNAVIGSGGHNNDYAVFAYTGLGDTTNYALLQANDGTTYLNSDSGKVLNFRIGNQSKMVINSDGNVGIGTTNPSTGLDVNGNFQSQFTRIFGRSSQGYIGHRNFLDDIESMGNTGSTYQYNYAVLVAANGNHRFNASDVLSLCVQNSTKLTINSSGNVGIGTTSPNDKLEVNGVCRSCNITVIINFSNIIAVCDWVICNKGNGVIYIIC